MALYNNVTKTDGNVRLTLMKNLALILNNIKSLLPLNLTRINKIYLFDISARHVRLSPIYADIYLFLVFSFYVSIGFFCFLTIFDIHPSEVLGLFNNSDLRVMVRDRDEQLDSLESKISSLKDENTSLSSELKKAEEDLEQVLHDIKHFKRKFSSEDLLVMLVLLGVVGVCLSFLRPDVETILLAPVSEEEFMKGLYWQLKCAVSVLRRTNSGELPSFQEQNFSREDIDWLKAHLKFMVRLARCFTRGLKEQE